MKKLVLVSMLVMAGFGFVSAATDGTLGLQGAVTANLSVAISAGAAATTLDLTATQTGLVVGSAKFITNNNTWKIAVNSTNGSKLKASGISDEVAYTFSLGTISGMTGITLPASVPGTPQGSMTGKTPALGSSYDMILIYTGVANLTAATYTDTITVTVTAP
jgi:hypothetical protein